MVFTKDEKNDKKYEEWKNRKHAIDIKKIDFKSISQKM